MASRDPPYEHGSKLNKENTDEYMRIHVLPGIRTRWCKSTFVLSARNTPLSSAASF